MVLETAVIVTLETRLPIVIFGAVAISASKIAVIVILSLSVTILSASELDKEDIEGAILVLYITTWPVKEVVDDKLPTATNLPLLSISMELFLLPPIFIL